MAMTKTNLSNKVTNILKVIGNISIALFIYAIVQEVVFDVLPLILPASFIQANGYFFLDTISCVFSILLLLLMYQRVVHQKFTIEVKGNEIPMSIVSTLSIMMTFGMGRISGIWMDFAYTSLRDIPLISNSIDSFNTSWSTVNEDPYIWVFLSVVLLGPIVEEILFRGIIHNLIKKVTHPIVAIVISGLLFGIWHGEPIQVVYTAIFGIALAVIYEYSGSLWITIGMHILNNFTSTLPSGLDTDLTYTMIDSIEVLMLIPTIILLAYMIHSIYNRSKNNEIDYVSR